MTIIPGVNNNYSSLKYKYVTTSKANLPLNKELFEF